MSFMDATCPVTVLGLTVTVTGWKTLGWIGALCFAGRWFIQAWHRKRTKSAAMPTSFWVVSVIGAALTSVYFIWGKNDSVGILQNVLPLGVALYNLALDLGHRRSGAPTAP